MQAVKDKISSLLHSNKEGDSTTESSSSSSGPTTTSTSTANDEQQLSQRTQNLSLDESKPTTTTELDSQTTTNALKERQSAQPQTTTSGATTGAPPVAATHSLTNTSAKDEGAEVPSVEDEVSEVTHDASAKAVADHTRLLSELENTVKEVQPAAAGVAGNGKGTDTPVRSIQREVHDAAPDADPSAVHAHSLLVSEIEAVVPDSADGKPVHELTKGIQRVGTPAELNRSSLPVDPTPILERHADPVHNGAPSGEQPSNPFQSTTTSTGEPDLNVLSVGDAVVVEPQHGEISPEELEARLSNRP